MLPYRPPSAHSKCHGEHGSDGLTRLPTSRGSQIRIAFMVGVRHPVTLAELREERTNSPLLSQLEDVLELREVGLVLSLWRGL